MVLVCGDVLNDVLSELVVDDVRWWRANETYFPRFGQKAGSMTLSRKPPENRSMEVSRPDDSWNEWLQLYSPRLLLIARQWTNSLSDAEDVVQEAFVRYWRHQRNLPGEPMALLVTSVRRAAIDLARSNSRRTARENRVVPELDEHAPIFEPLLNDERRVAIEAALRQLPSEQREVLVLKIWGELTFKEIAEQLDVPANTVASRYRYALAAIRSQLADTVHL
jgi:RNA polymerase sigma-70 factor, ECF subfamily